MSPDAPTLAFLLDSPLQSWGESSRFNRRGTGPHPTKSGIVALLACARGIDKHADDEAELLAPVASLRLTTVLLPRIQYDWRGEPRTGKAGSLRSHRPLRFTDFHTIGGAWERDRESYPWESLHVPVKAKRTEKGENIFIDGPAVVTYRNYLLDSRFAIFLQGDSAELETCAADFQNPRWGLWLGRKSCIPSVPILPELHPDLQSAWDSLATRAGFPAETPLTSFDRCQEVTATDAASFVLLDQPVSFGKREFHARRVRRLASGELP